MNSIEINLIAEKNNIVLLEDYVEDDFFSVVCWFDVKGEDRINYSVKEGSTSELEKILNQKANDILLLYPDFECNFITFADRMILTECDREMYYFEFTKKDIKW